MIIKNIKGHFEGGTISVGGISLFGFIITSKKNVGNVQIKDTTLVVDTYEKIIEPLTKHNIRKIQPSIKGKNRRRRGGWKWI